MKRLTVALCSMLALYIVGCNDAANTNSSPTADSAAAKKDSPAAAAITPPPPMDPAAMDKAMKEYAEIREPHKMLASQSGKWNEEVSMWMDPSQPPLVNKATCVNSMILGGRYQQSKHVGTFNNQPFEGIGTLGYDNAEKVFVSSWVDNMGTGIMYLKGPYDEASKTITLTGKMIDPTTKQECAIREVVTFADGKNHKVEMYGTPSGMGEMKMMEIKMTKQ